MTSQEQMFHVLRAGQIRAATAIADLSRIALLICALIAAITITLTLYFWGQWALFAIFLTLVVASLWLFVWVLLSLPVDPDDIIGSGPPLDDSERIGQRSATSWRRD